MHPYFQHLKLPLLVDLRPYALFSCDPERNGHIQLESETLPDELLQFLDKHHMFCYHAEAFYTAPDRQNAPHVDNKRFSDRCKLNFVYGGEGSVMKWFKRKDESKVIEPRENAIGKHYVGFQAAEIDEVAETVVGCPTLVNVGQIHSVVNQAQARWCLSVVLGNVKNREAIPFIIAAMRLREYAV